MTGKTAIVTGGSRGIGRAICLALAEKGANLVINYAGNEKAAEETAQQCKNLGVEAVIVKGDVSNAQDCQTIVDTAIGRFDGVEILVNNAGITKDNLLARMSEEDFDAVIATNLKGTFLMMKAVTRHMMKKRYGRIVNISSVVGLMGNAGQMNYSGSKAGVIGMTKSMARELASRGVTANAVAPGFIETDMTAELNQTAVEKSIQAIPAGRMGSAEEVARAVAFLAGAQSGYITGQVLCVDGGMCMM